MIKSIVTATTLLISGVAFADVPNTFEAGSAIKASEMNENFTSINNDVNTISDDISDLDSKTANYSDLETDVASLKAKVELLETLLASDDSIATAEFVGFSEDTKGNVGGLNGMNQICDNAFPESRMCTTKDIFANGFPAIPVNMGSTNGYARVHNNSDILAVSRLGDSNKIQYRDWTMVEDKADGNCLIWTVDNSQYRHSTLNYNVNTDTTTPSVSACSEAIPNACCK